MTIDVKEEVLRLTPIQIGDRFLYQITGGIFIAIEYRGTYVLFTTPADASNYRSMWTRDEIKKYFSRQARA